jgi:hypothetical protein
VQQRSQNQANDGVSLHESQHLCSRFIWSRV